VSHPLGTVADMTSHDAVDAPPATQWDEPRPPDLHPAFWAETRPTDATLATLDVPEGEAVHGADGRLLGWIAAPGTTGLGELWLRLARQFPQTGLWPVRDTWYDLEEGRNWGHPYWEAPYAVAKRGFHAGTLPDRMYRDVPGDPGVPYIDLEEIADYVSAPEVTLAEPSAMEADPLSTLRAPTTAEKLVLLVCRRPADAVLTLDFGVPNDDATPGMFVGVLRSWESRFGVVPEQLHPAWTTFQVIAPPSSETDMRRLATEVIAFALDTASQGGFGGTGRAEEMVGTRSWSIWWD